MKKNIFVFCFGDNYGLNKNLTDLNSSFYNFVVQDVSQKVNFCTRLKIVLSLYFCPVFFVLNEKFLADGDGVYLAKLGLKSSKSQFLTYDSNLLIPSWLPEAKVNLVSIADSAEDIRDALRFLGKSVL
jgi:hypothetical protein